METRSRSLGFECAVILLLRSLLWDDDDALSLLSCTGVAVYPCLQNGGHCVVELASWGLHFTTLCFAFGLLVYFYVLFTACHVVISDNYSLCPL